MNRDVVGLSGPPGGESVQASRPHFDVAAQRHQVIPEPGVFEHRDLICLAPDLQISS